ncbi:HAD family hydrolase [Halomonas maura]|uniref:HAD family hydrolase n=1 Tax=Halomonas maura TaxID=117606 RepID=UPI0025B55327|nr:HAD family hydrolase [Halomonas maura]MDN3556833.1 HAD family hydrolase [Halomonas maura]
MVDTFLFDWGGTLMRDFPDAQGKMCNWEFVEVVDGAEMALSHISETRKIYIATSAEDSTESDIEKAFERVGLNKYISGYFCKSNVGLGKGTPEFFQAILAILGKEPDNVAMVGDNLQKDIVPAAEVGIETYWLTARPEEDVPRSTRIIGSLGELCA